MATDQSPNPALQFAANLRDLQAGRVTVEQARKRNRAQREQLGDDKYDAAKALAAAAIMRGAA
jgi:hypothetical protein